MEHTHTEQVEPDMIPLAAVTAIVPNMEAILLAPDETVMEVPATAAMAVMAVLATEVTKPTEQLLLAPITPHVSKLRNGLNRSNLEDVSAASTPVLEVR